MAAYVPNILSLVKNSLYNLGTIDAVDITVELPENQRSSNDKHRGVLAFVFFPFWVVRHHYGLVQTGII